VVLEEDLLMIKEPSDEQEVGKIMGSIILTGISHGKHQFSLTYPEVEGVMICMAHCKCGYEVEIINFRSYGGGKDLEKKWQQHIGTWKGWV
jgi:hypothetical protein